MPLETQDAGHLLVLAADHRIDLRKEILGSDGDSPSAVERERAAAFKQMVFEGLAQAIEASVPKSRAVIWVDADLGEAVLLRARAMALATAVSVERPGGDTFRLEDAAGLSERLGRLGASYAGVRVLCRAGITREERDAQLSALRLLSEACRSEGPSLLLELVVLPSDGALTAGDAAEWNEKAGPLLAVEAMRELQDAGVEPSVWVVEAPTDARAAATIAAQAHLDDRVGISVLFAVGNEPDAGRTDPAPTAEQQAQIRLAARTLGVTGLLVGPAAYFGELALYNSGEMDRGEAVSRIASGYRHLCEAFSQAHHTSDVT